MMTHRVSPDDPDLLHVWIPVADATDVDTITPLLVAAAATAWGDLRAAEFEALPPVVSLEPDSGTPSWRFALVRSTIAACPLCEGRGHLPALTADPD